MTLAVFTSSPRITVERASPKAPGTADQGFRHDQ
jgi:hypothetical protein